jgi:1,4-alpha-glucan branching enzyme
MQKILLILTIIFYFKGANAQLLSWSPQFPNDNSVITITVDGAKGNQSLLGYAGTVYMHLGVITNLSTSNTDWKHVTTNWGTTTAPAATPAGVNKWSFTINNPRAYFSVPPDETILRVALLFRDATGDIVQKNTDISDMYIPVYASGGNHIQFTQPFITPTFNFPNEAVAGALGQSVPVTALASRTDGTLNLYINGTLINGPIVGTNTISASAVPVGYGNQLIVAELITGGASYYDTVLFYLPPPNTTLALPPGVKEGINYWPGCDSVSLVLYAPNKLNVVVLGDFPNNNWAAQSQYQMNKTPDGNYYWLTIHGLTGGVEYSFQYLVDNAIYIADPYSEKILDPWNDQYIPAATYPNPKPYPVNQNVSPSTNGFVSVLKTCSTPYKWQVTNFVKPDKRNLITYELLIRDFGDAGNYQMLIDTISYFKRLGINAIELMPVNEFSGNKSWGYNPTFYLALDKAYGTKDKFKEFVDLCHKNGIAVILDVVYNQLDAYNAPQGKLYWDAANNRPAANNPWLNTSAPHPYSVFEDLNHTSVATQYLVKRALEYWITEYKIDGYRLDLAKGFTQTVSDQTTVENKDQSRIDNLFRYYNHIVPMFPGTYMILEFLGQQYQEEQQYSFMGFLLWGNNNPTYNQNTMGYSSNSDFSKIVYNSTQQKFFTPAEMGYMESHDEERLMYKNLQYGNASGAYNVKDLATALDRQAAAAAIFFTVPGPKMFWQFGERGYDTSLNFNGRTGNKPSLWHYMADPNRIKLFNAYSQLINLRLANPAVFNSSSFSYNFDDNAGLFKRFQIADPAANGMQVAVIANFDVIEQTRSITFQKAGDWYNYLSNGNATGINGPSKSTFNVGALTQSITLAPGEYHVYIYLPSTVYSFIGNGNWTDASNWSYNRIPPTPLPSGSEIIVSPQSGGECILNTPQNIGPGAKFTVVAGKKFRIPLNLTNH